MLLFRKCIRYCVLTLWVSLSFAQKPAHFTYSIENGAPSNEIYCILEDQQGFIWIGCDAGVFRYNGVSYKQFSSTDLRARSATGFIQAPGGAIYGYNFKNQLLRIKDDSLEVIKEWNKPINGVKADHSGNIWISSSTGFYRMNEQSRKIDLMTWEGDRKQAGATFTDNVCSGKENRIFYHNNGQIVERKGKQVKSLPFTSEYYNLPCYITSHGDTTWMVSYEGKYIYYHSGNEWSRLNSSVLSRYIANHKITAISNFRGNELWISTFSGLIRYFIKEDKAELLFGDAAISYVIEDREGNIWISTLHDGLYRIPDINVRYWSSDAFFLNQKDRLTALTSDGSTFYGAGSNGYISSINAYSNEFKRYEHLPASDLGTIYFDRIDQCVYFNKIDALYELKNGVIHSVNTQVPPVKMMLHDRNGYLLLTSGGLYALNSINGSITEKGALIAKDWFRDITNSPFDDGYFLAGNMGVYHLSHDGGTRKIVEHFMKDRQILSLTADQDNRCVYFFESSGDLMKYSGSGTPKLSKHFEEDVRPYQIRCHKGLIYLATNKGLLIYDPNTGDLQTFDVYDGLPSNNVTGLQFDQLNNIWLSTGSGICKMPIHSLNKTIESRIVLHGVKVGSRKFSPDERIELSHDDVLIIEADGLSYVSNGDYHFTYKIEGAKGEWVEVYASKGRITLPNLPSGDYRLILKLKDYKGRDSINRITLQLSVLPPFWQRWWFYLLIVAAVAFVGYLIFRRRIKVLRIKQREALQKLKLENELRLTQQSALKAQMNPHFIFNVLNSIKGYIYESDKQNAIRYLSDFSGLVRKVLDMSSKSTVTLSEELDAVELYIHLEAMLLDSEFDYAFEIDSDVDTEFLRVPALIIQPYVENAFKHGLRHKQGSKELKMQVRKVEQDVLEIRISDNGVGREASAEINSRNQATHESFASEASKKRIDLLNHRQKELVGVEIVDNFDKQGDPSGTTVIIRIHV